MPNLVLASQPCMICLACNTTFDKDEVVEVEDTEASEFWGQRGTRKVMYKCCPNCGSDEIQETDHDSE